MGEVGCSAGCHSELEATDGRQLVGHSAHEAVHGHLQDSLRDSKKALLNEALVPTIFERMVSSCQQDSV